MRRVPPAWGFAAAAILLGAAYWLVVPDIHRIGGGNCPLAEEVQLSSHDWLAIREPQIGSGVFRYEAQNDTTYVVPGCSHGTAEFAVKIRGKVAPEDDFSLFLDPETRVDGSLEPVEPPLSAGNGPQGNVTHALTARFEKRNLAVHGTVFLATMEATSLAIGFAVPDLPGRRRVTPAVGVTVGFTLVVVAWFAGAAIVPVILAPILVLVSVPLFPLGRNRPKLRLLRWAMLTAAAGLVLAFAFLFSVMPAPGPAA